MTVRDDLAHAERALLEHAAYGRSRVRAGALTACLAEGRADALMHVAVPSGPEPTGWDDSVQALIALHPRHGTVPRLEFMAELHPALAQSLERHGFVRTSSDPVMTLDLQGALPASAVPAPGYRRLAANDPELLSAFVEQQAEAFGMPPATGYAFLERLQDTIAAGTSIAAALLGDGTPVAGAVLQLGASGWAELAGVYTAPASRGRGLAMAACTRLLADARVAGVTHAWLSAAEGARGLYRRLGFRSVGSQLNYRYAPFSAADVGPHPGPAHG
ncbi:MAG TPA: GNAT family N-acetyltransferase [Trueperaceae bacterium]|nr:GNAT family N-acetyltransferase [Trueperaceae bacterium]